MWVGFTYRRATTVRLPIAGDIVAAELCEGSSLKRMQQIPKSLKRYPHNWTSHFCLSQASEVGGIQINKNVNKHWHVSTNEKIRKQQTYRDLRSWKQTGNLGLMVTVHRRRGVCWNLGRGPRRKSILRDLECLRYCKQWLQCTYRSHRFNCHRLLHKPRPGFWHVYF